MLVGSNLRVVCYSYNGSQFDDHLQWGQPVSTSPLSIGPFLDFENTGYLTYGIRFVTADVVLGRKK